jgi:hypothetical protein
VEWYAGAAVISVGRNIMNRRTVIIATTLLGLAISVPQASFAQSNPLIGTWKTNLAKSTYNPGPPPRSLTLTFETEGQSQRLTIENINAQGNPVKVVVIRPNNDGDGKPYPVVGVAAFDAEAIKTINDTTSWIIRTKAGKVVTTIVSVMSADGKTFNDTITGINANGQPFYNFQVYDKQ